MRPERQFLFWLTAGVLLILTIGLLKDILLPFVAGITIAYFLNPVVDRLASIGINRIVASLFIVAAGGVLVILALVLLVPLVIDQAQRFAEALPAETERLQRLLETWARERLGSRFQGFEQNITRAFETLAQNWTGLAAWAATSIWSGSLALFNFLALMLVTPLVVFYLLVDWHPMLDKIDGWLPRGHAASIRALASDMNDAIAAFIRGQGTVCIVLGAFYSAALSAAGLNYGLLVGLATGFLAFIPFVGWALGLITALGLAVVQFWPDAVAILVVAGIYLGGQALDAGFLSPNIVGSKIGLHPVWLIFSLFVFTYLFGFVGALVAVPLAAATAVLVRFGLGVYLESQVYRGQDPAGGPAATAPRDLGR
jgi:predicted PurR-regulated permease PerM